jgi:hypothetical protein
MRQRQHRHSAFYFIAAHFILFLLTAIYLVPTDTHIANATVAFDGNTIHNAHLDGSLSNEIAASNSEGKFYFAPQDPIISYDAGQWSLGPIAWTGIIMTLLSAILCVDVSLKEIKQIVKQSSDNGGE